MSNELMGIFDRAIELSKAMAEDRKREEVLSVLRAQAATECASCINWMIYQSCPAETRVNGRRKGPSARDSRAHGCRSFERTTTSSEAIDKLKASNA